LEARSPIHFPSSDVDGAIRIAHGERGFTVTGAAELDGGDGGKRLSVPLSVQQKGMQGYRLIVDTLFIILNVVKAVPEPPYSGRK